MAYRVRLTVKAERDVTRIYKWALKQRSASAIAYCNGLQAEVLSLRQNPERCHILEEYSNRRRTLRQLVYGEHPNAYRILFEITDDVVSVIHIRHGSRRLPKRL